MSCYSILYISLLFFTAPSLPIHYCISSIMNDSVSGIVDKYSDSDQPSSAEVAPIILTTQAEALPVYHVS